MADFTKAVFAWWTRLAPLPLGRWLFSRVLGLMVPYSGGIRATVRELRPGFARLALKDRRGVRQHLGSVHAVALVNLGELTSGLAMLSALPPGVRAIVTRISAEYFKKARGMLRAEATVAPPAVTGPVDFPIQAVIYDQAGDAVCRVEVHWRLDLGARG